MSRHALVVRLDGMGDVLISGPAVRAVAASARVTMLVGPDGAAAARLLPGVEDVLVWQCPWIVRGASVHPAAIDDVCARIAALGVDEALILTSFHQSALPTALVLRLAGVRRIAAISEDFPGALLDTRLPDPPDAPEPERMLALARGAGYELPVGDDGRLALRDPLPASTGAPDLPDGPYIVVHPGTNAPARTYPAEHFAAVVGLLTAAGRTVVVTGSASEADLAARVSGGARPPGRALGTAGTLDLCQLAAVLRGAAVVVAGNTGPAHLAAAAGTPVVALFAPVVPAARWAPFGVPVALLGDQHAPCRNTRAVTCPIARHPCLASVDPRHVVRAVQELAVLGVHRGVPA